MITGDFVITSEYSNEKIDSEVFNIFNDSDLNIVNLECPVTSASEDHKIIKTGPHIKGNKESISNVLKSLNIGLVTLANNHILDYGEKGLLDTVSFCEEIKIDTCGAGQRLNSASTTYTRKINGLTIAILNFAENEWSSASTNSAGANPLDLVDNVKQIQQAKLNSDVVLVIIHGGHEYYNLPSPRIQKQYRFYAENGADLIVAHHPHCISGHEIHNGVPIYYSLGNFLFTHSSEYPDWYKGIALEVTINEQKELNTAIHLVKQEKDFSLKMIESNNKHKELTQIAHYKEVIENSELLQLSWEAYIKKMQSDYLYFWSPLSFIKNRYIRAIIGKLKIKMINKKGIALYLNLIRCEAHSDLSKSIMTKYLKE